MHQWVNLTTRLGESVSQPTDGQMQSTINELFASSDDEHPDAWIECGSESGPLYSLSVFSSGYAIYTKYSDADMTDELESKRIEPVDSTRALAMWKKMIGGQVDEI